MKPEYINRTLEPPPTIPPKIKEDTMTELSITASMNYKFIYDSESLQFKDALKNYKESIQPTATEYDVIKQCAHHFAIGGTIHGIVEGVGYVWQKRQKKGNEPFSGIYIDNDNPTVELEII